MVGFLGVACLLLPLVTHSLAHPMMLRTTWGFDDWVYRPQDWAARLSTLSAEGYIGIDADLDFVSTIKGGSTWAYLCQEHGLQFVPTVATATGSEGIFSNSVADHLESLRNYARLARSANVTLLNVHGGYDGWSVQDAVEYLSGALEIEAAEGVRIAHETHRRRLFHSPWQLTAVLEALPKGISKQIKLTADLSHWVVVGSRFYDYPADAGPFETAMKHLVSRCVHVHARVAYSEGCQVPHPSAPEYKFALDAHMAWWSRICEAQEARADACMIMPEFGPVPGAKHTISSAYMPRLPFTDQPVADVNECNTWMASHIRQQYKAAQAEKLEL